MKYRFDGKEKMLSFGTYPAVSLVDARAQRTKAKAALDEGKDPGAKEGAPASAMTFEAVAREWHALRLDSLDPGHAERLMARLERDAFPALGRKKIGDVTPADVLAMVRKVEARGALDVSRRLKQHVNQIYRFAIPNGWAVHDPAASLGDALKPKPRVKHMARVGFQELPDLVRAIDGYDGEENPRRRAITRAALLFTLLTWARTGETRLARWDEFENLEQGDALWRVPAERMKMDREHLVPLPRQAVALISDLREYRTSDFVFAGEKPNKPLSQNTMIYGCYRMGYRGKQTVHGFRGIASTWANEAEIYRPDWVEMALAHGDEDEVRGAYNSALYLSPRRRMLQRWADMISGLIAPPHAANDRDQSDATVAAELAPQAEVPPPVGPCHNGQGRRSSVPLPTPATRRSVGTLDVGVETILAERIDVLDDRLLRRDPDTGAETRLQRLDLHIRRHATAFAELMNTEGRAGDIAFLRNRQSGRVALRVPSWSVTDEEGRPIAMCRLVRPTGSDRIAADKLRLGHWQPIAEAAFRVRWEAEADEARNRLDRETITIATGLLLPVWNKLPDDTVRVWRIADAHGFSQLGRIVPAHALGRLADNFGINALPRLSVDETIVAATTGEGAPLPALGKARLHRALVNGDTRLEVRDYPSEKREWLKSLGCFTEIIQYRTRLFVPVDRAATILGLIDPAG